MANRRSSTHNSLSHRRQRYHFIAAAVRSPFKIGSVLPSSRGLAKAMASGIDTAREGTIIELGAGTGVVTSALLKAGIAPEKLLVIERDERLHQLMALQFPELQVVKADAMHLESVMAECGVTKINAIVSSLPFLSMPDHVREAIQQQIVTLMGKEGRLIQFTYGLLSPINAAMMRNYRLCGRRIKLVVANIPPAHVWIYHRERRAQPR